MGATNSLSTLFKQVYGDGAIRAVPDFAKIMKTVPFSKKEKLGDAYVIPTVLQHEHGFSYGASGDADFTLNASVAGAVLQAQVRGAMIVLRSRLSYEDVFKASEAGAAAFESATSLVVENMQKSFAKRLELAFLYGQNGIGTVLTNTNSPSTTATLVLTTGSWGPGIWSGMKSCPLDAFDVITATATQRNTNANLVVSSVTMSSRTVVVTGNATDCGNVTVGDVLYFKGARTTTGWKECAGIDKILTNTGSLFNIDAASYELWKGNSRAVGGAISFLAILNGIGDASNMGLMEDAEIHLGTKRWNVLNADQAGLRRYGAYSAKFENGSEGIVYHSTNGKSEVVAHPFLKEGDGFLLPNPKKRLLRVGASDITFRRPGREDDIFLEIPDVAGLELRAFCDQAIFIQVPAQGTKYTGITD